MIYVHLVLVLLSLCVFGAANENIWLPGFTGLFWTSSLVTSNGRWLYIDGGEIWNGTNDEFRNGFPLGSTVIIDLTQSWTNTTLPILHSANKPNDFPYSRYPTIWYSESDNTIYSYGGSVYWNTFCPGNCNQWEYNDRIGYLSKAKQPPADKKLWQLTTDDTELAYGSWAPSPPSLQPSDSIAPATFGGLATTVGENLWNLGGLYTGSGYDAWAAPGLAKYDSQTKTWSNSTESPPQYSSLGQAISAPLGSEGVIFYLGGYSSSKQYTSYGNVDDYSYFASMKQIRIYDIASGSYYMQSLAGPTPPDRYAFCAVGVQDAKGHLDIFTYGGVSYQGSIGDIYVLSIPEFTWTQIKGKKAASLGRAYHTCQVIGQRQMVSIGGSQNGFPNRTDPFSNGIGVFDMTTLAWAPRYDPHAPEYVRSKVIQKALSRVTIPGISSPVLKLFPDKLKPKDAIVASSNNVGAIAGGVVGGIVGISVIGFAIWFYLRRRRRQRHQKQPFKTQTETTEKNMEKGEPFGEYYNSYGDDEADSLEPHELPVKPAPAELPGERPELSGSPSTEVWEMGSATTMVGTKSGLQTASPLSTNS